MHISILITFALLDCIHIYNSKFIQDVLISPNILLCSINTNEWKIRIFTQKLITLVPLLKFRKSTFLKLQLKCNDKRLKQNTKIYIKKKRYYLLIIKIFPNFHKHTISILLLLNRCINRKPKLSTTSHIYILKILFSLSRLESVPLFHEHRKQVEKLPAANNPVEK